MHRAWGKFGATAIATLALLAGLVTVAPQASAATTVQNGQNNCAAPAQSDCPFTVRPILDSYTNSSDVQQTSSSTGQNFFKSTAANAKAVQSGPNNKAVLTNAQTTTNTALSTIANVTQSGGGTNDISIDYSSTSSTGNIVSLQTVNQVNKILVNTSQNGATNILNEKALTSQTAQTTLAFAGQVTHSQQEMICSTNSMIASVKNTANFDLSRAQSSNAQGSPVNILQDNQSDSEPAGCALGLGSVNLTANSTGENAIKLVKGNDNKSATASPILGGVGTVRQGVNGGGWLFGGSVNTGVQNPAVCDLQLGLPGSTGGLRKVWNATVNGGTSDVNQNDEIRIPFLSKSPFCMQANSDAKVTGPAHAVQIIKESLSSEAHDAINARLFGSLDSGGGAKEKVVTVTNAKNADVSLQCNGTVSDNDTCGSTEKPVSHASMGVRKGGTSDAFGNSVTVNSGDNVEYQGTITNDGSGNATGGSLAWTVPSGLSFGSGEGCSEASGVVTCSVGAVGAGQSVSKTFTAVANSSGNAGPFTTHLVGDDDQEPAFNSNDTTVNVAQPSSSASATVRNVTTNGTAGSSASAEAGQKVEWAGKFTNAGSGYATGATLTTTVPANMTYVACSCTVNGSTLTWDLGTVPSGTVTVTFQATVNSGTAVGTVIHNTFTGDDDQEAAFTSNDASVTVTAPPTLTVKLKIFGASSGTIPVAMLSQPNDNNPTTLDDATQINPSTVCFGKTTTASMKDCAGKVQSTGDSNGDGLNDLKMGFSQTKSGVLPTDKTACITGKTYSGQNVQGCGPTK